MNYSHSFLPDDEQLASSYDKLIIAVGSSSSTHGVPGLENCFQLKTIGDAQAIRRRIMGTFHIIVAGPSPQFCVLDNFEAASLPTTSVEERKRLLSFVICGGGPTGVETAAVSSNLFQ
jgi:NADH dehydrogenase FAD-containing subunit